METRLPRSAMRPQHLAARAPHQARAPQPHHSATAPQPHHSAMAPQPHHSAVAPQPRHSAVAPQPHHSAVAPQPRHSAVAPQPHHSAVAPQPHHSAMRAPRPRRAPSPASSRPRPKTAGRAPRLPRRPVKRPPTARSGLKDRSLRPSRRPTGSRQRRKVTPWPTRHSRLRRWPRRVPVRGLPCPVRRPLPARLKKAGRRAPAAGTAQLISILPRRRSAMARADASTEESEVLPSAQTSCRPRTGTAAEPTGEAEALTRPAPASKVWGRALERCHRKR